MTRYKNENWKLPSADSDNSVVWEAIHAALMMDIRDELQQLNRLLSCHRFVGIPNVLARIDKRLRLKFPLGNKKK